MLTRTEDRDTQHSGVSPAEFFALASEYFLDVPEEFQREHPELYKY